MTVVNIASPKWCKCRSRGIVKRSEQHIGKIVRKYECDCGASWFTEETVVSAGTEETVVSAGTEGTWRQQELPITVTFMDRLRRLAGLIG